MLADRLLTFSRAQAITATARSTDTVDLGATGIPVQGLSALSRDIGFGTLVPIRVQVTEDFATLTSLTVALQVDDNSAFSSPTTVLQTAAIPVATLKAGYVFNIEYLLRGVNERHLSLLYTVGGSNATAGRVDARVVLGAQAWP